MPSADRRIGEWVIADRRGGIVDLIEEGVIGDLLPIVDWLIPSDNPPSINRQPTIAIGNQQAPIEPDRRARIVHLIDEGAIGDLLPILDWLIPIDNPPSSINRQPAISIGNQQSPIRRQSTITHPSIGHLQSAIGTQTTASP